MIRSLLASPDFLRLWLVGASSNAMRWLELLAVGLYTFEVTGSASAVAEISAARMLPMLLFGAFAGAISESLNRKYIVLGGLALGTLNALILTALATTGRLELWHIAAGGFLSGTIWSSEMATRRRMIGEVAGPERVVQAISLDSVTNAATRMFGPLLGGIIFEWLGIAGAYACTATVQLVSALVIGGLTYAQDARPMILARIPSDILAGLRLARTRPIIMMVFVITVIVNMFGFSYSSLIPPIGSGQFRLSPTLVGVLAAAEPLGGIIGGAALATGLVQLGARTVFAGGSMLFFASLVGMSLSASYTLAIFVLIVGGIGTAGFSNMQSTLILTEAPADMRSRLLGIVTVCIGTGPLGVLGAGWIANGIGAANAVLCLALVGLLAVALTALRLPKAPRSD
jgi:MFS family permease